MTTPKILFIVAGIFAIAPLSLAQLPSATSLAIAPGPAGAVVRMDLTDPGNHVWLVERSTNLIDWTPVTTTKVHNRIFRYNGLPEPGVNASYYRAGYDAAAQNLTSTLDSALNLGAAPANYSMIPLPGHLLAPLIAGQNNTPVTNPTTNPGAELGRVLFYDKRLSLNQTISCASCHQAAHGFSDPNRFSTAAFVEIPVDGQSE